MSLSKQCHICRLMERLVQARLLLPVALALPMRQCHRQHYKKEVVPEL